MRDAHVRMLNAVLEKQLLEGSVKNPAEFRKPPRTTEDRQALDDLKVTGAGFVLDNGQGYQLPLKSIILLAERNQSEAARQIVADFDRLLVALRPFYIKDDQRFWPVAEIAAAA